MPFSSVFLQYFLKPKLRAASLHHFTCPTKSWSCAETANPRLRNVYTGTQSWNPFTGFAFFCSNSSSSSLPSASSVVLRRSRNADSKLPPRLFGRSKLALGRFVSDEYGSVDSDGEAQSSSNQLDSATPDNVEDWEQKLTTLMGCEEEQEIVSREKKDRRDFRQLSALATRMGLHCRQYEKVVVFSKVPLPNYRSDLDAKRPQREVVLPFELENEVNAHLTAHLSKKAVNKEILHNFYTTSNVGQGRLIDGRCEDQENPSTKSEIVKRILILLQRSLQMQNKQQEWQESSEGQKMLDFRRSLPSHQARETLLHTISQNQVVVVSGETGCGKTTQLPQYILESEIEASRGAACSIICTQPRRISAIAVAERVAAERGEGIGESVGYSVRLERMRGRDTRLLFCTTGILLRKLVDDRNLKGVTHIIIDEIHERGMNEDFLLIVLKDLLPRRPELKLVLMSATLNAELFASFFGGAPTIHIPGFTYPVQTHFLENILEMTGYRLTTYNQIDNYGRDKLWIMQKQNRRRSKLTSAVEETLIAANLREHGPRVQESLSCWNPEPMGFNLIEHVLCHICQKERPGAVLVFMLGWEDIHAMKQQLKIHPLLGDPRKVLLLACHGSMSSAEQKLIFDKPEDGVRKIVLSTNIAETSITINDVVFVVDCGKVKETSYDALNNTPCLLPSWISKASARQRKGRAGRVQPGECYHLYPRRVHDAFADYQLPELLRTPLDSLCLQIKSLQLGNISEFLSKALQHPEPLSVQNAIEYLKTVGALDEKENLTVLGRHLSRLPVEPKLGKMLIFGAIFNCLSPIMTIVGRLTSRDPFFTPYDQKDIAMSARAQFSARDFSDHLAVIRAFDGWIDAERHESGYEYCRRNFLSAKTLAIIDSLRKQFLPLLKDIGLVENFESCNTYSHDENLVRAVICAGLFPGICSVVNKEKSILLKTVEDGAVLLHPISVNAQETRIPFPWLVFNEKIKINTLVLRDSTGVSDSVVLLFGGNLSSGEVDGQLKMLDGYMEFSMKPELATMYLNLKRELDELIQMKLLNPKLDINNHIELLTAVRLLVKEDGTQGRFVIGGKNVEVAIRPGLGGAGSHFQAFLSRAGRQQPSFSKTKEVKSPNHNDFRSRLMFNRLDFGREAFDTKKVAAAAPRKLLTGDSRQPSEKTVEEMSVNVNTRKKNPFTF